MKNFENATRIFGLILLLLFVNLINYGQSIYTLPVGTQISARMDSEINSQVFSVNDTFTATVSKPLTVRNSEMLPVGTIIEGRIVKIKSAGRGKTSGSFEVRFENLKLPNGAERLIDAELIDSEKPRAAKISNAVLIGGGTVIGSLFGTLIGKTGAR